jgi:hypothetical protein
VSERNVVEWLLQIRIGCLPTKQSNKAYQERAGAHRWRSIKAQVKVGEDQINPAPHDQIAGHVGHPPDLFHASKIRVTTAGRLWQILQNHTHTPHTHTHTHTHTFSTLPENGDGSPGLCNLDANAFSTISALC